MKDYPAGIICGHKTLEYLGIFFADRLAEILSWTKILAELEQKSGKLDLVNYLKSSLSKIFTLKAG